MVFLIGISQSHFPEADGPVDETTFFGRQEKKNVSDDFSEGRHPPVFVVEEHAGAEDGMSTYFQDAPKQFIVPDEKRIGMMHENMVDPAGNMHTVLELFYNRPETERIRQEILKGERWGLSLCTDVESVPGSGRVSSKRITHLGITKNPEYGKDGMTWIYAMADDAKGLNNIIKEHYLSVPGMYAPPKMRARYNLPDQPSPATMSVGASKDPANKPELYTLSPATDINQEAALSSVPDLPKMMSSTMTNAEGHAINLSPAKDGSQPPGSQPITPALNGTTPYQVNVLDVPLTPNAHHLAKQSEMQQQAQFEQVRETQAHVVRSLNAEAAALFDGLNFSDPETFLDDERMEKIGNLREAYHKAINAAQWNMTEYPTGLLRRTAQIDEYLEKTMAVLTDHINATHKKESDKKLADEMIKDPLKYRPMLISTMAAAKLKIGNQRDMNERLKSEREVKEKYEKDLAAIKEANDKKFAEMKEESERQEKRIREFEDSGYNNKRQRTDTGSFNNTNAVAPAASQTLSVGATRGSSSSSSSTNPALESSVRKDGLISVTYDVDRFWDRYTLDPVQARNSVHTAYGKDQSDLQSVRELMAKVKSTTREMPIDGPPRYKF